MSKGQKYDESNIQVHMGLEGIRKRPSMYIGELGNHAIFHLIKEAVDNTLDEAMAGRNNVCEVVAKDNIFVVHDESGGIPVGLNKQLGISTLTAVFTHLHAGGKFDNKAFKVSAGCFTGDTKVRLLDGTTPTFEELYDRWQKDQTPFKVLSTNKEGEVSIQDCYHVQLSKYVTELAVVTLDNGKKVTCTVDHPFITRDGKKKRAYKLKAGDSLMSLHVHTDKDGYLYSHKTGRLNRFVAESLGWEIEDKHVHHKDGNKVNNLPENLVALTPKQHYEQHPEKLKLWTEYVNGSSRLEKSELITAWNTSSENNEKSIRGKILKICCRITHEGLKISKETYEQYYLHGAPSWELAVDYYYDGEEHLLRSARRYYTAKSKYSNFEALIDYVSGVSENSMVFDQSAGMVAKRIISRAKGIALENCSLKAIRNLSPSRFDTFKKAGGSVGASKVQAYMSWNDFLVYCRSDSSPVFYSDISEETVARREAKLKVQQYTEDTKKKIRTKFLRVCRGLHDSGQLSKDNYINSTNGNAQTVSWNIGLANLKYNFGVTSKDDFISEVENFNTKVRSIEIIKCEPTPVYGISVTEHHNYLLDAGVFVGNTHGVGNKAITALSTRLEVWTFRDGAWHYQKFSKGLTVTEVLKKKPSPEVLELLPKSPKKGTILLWEPDKSILGKNAKLVLKDLVSYLEGLAYLNKGFKISLRYWDQKGAEKTENYCNTIGPAYFVSQMADKMKLKVEGKPLVIESEHFDCAVQLSDYEEGDGVSGYVNSSLTIDGGKHLDGFWSALTKALQPFANRRHKYTPRDLRFGLIGYINLRVSGPKFSSQTKEKLVGFAIDVKGQTEGQLSADLQLELEKPDVAVEKYILPYLNNEFKKNKVFPKAILDRATSVAKAREQSKELMKAASKLKVKDKHDPLPDVLYTATKAGPEEREIFIVEGDSAAGCHSGDTEVLLADGTKKTFVQLVQDFENGIDNYGIAYNLTQKKFTKFKFYHPRITKYVSEMCEIVFDNGVVWRGTPNHPWLLTNGKYKRADELGPDDVIQEVPNPSDLSNWLDS